MCKYCEIINTDYDNGLPTEKNHERVVTEIRYKTERGLYYWSRDIVIPLNYCPNCGNRMEGDVDDSN